MICENIFVCLKTTRDAVKSQIEPPKALAVVSGVLFVSQNAETFLMTMERRSDES